MYHTVLFQEIISVFILRYFCRIMPCRSVYFYCDFSVRRVKGIINGTMIAVDIYKGILQIDILPFLRSEHIAEQLYEFFFRAAVSGAIRLNGRHYSVLHNFFKKDFSVETSSLMCLSDSDLFHFFR